MAMSLPLKRATGSEETDLEEKGRDKLVPLAGHGSEGRRGIGSVQLRGGAHLGVGRAREPQRSRLGSL